MQTNVIRRVTIEGVDRGITETEGKLRRLSSAQSGVIQLSDHHERATLSVERALEKQQRALDVNYRSMKQFERAQLDIDRAQQQGLITSARQAELLQLNQRRFDEVTRAANDNAKEVNASVVSTTKEVVELGSKLKTMGTVAYLTWPAFRNGVNLQALPALKLLGEGIKEIAPVAHAAGSAAAIAMGPAVSMFLRLGPPILAIVVAWKALNYVADLGAGLLDKYANAQRQLFGSDVEDNLKKLTKFQQETLSLQQVQYATELGARLETATKTISDFQKVQFDLTNPALKLQNVWVVIVELVASALAKLNEFLSKAPAAISSAAAIAARGVAGALPGGGLLVAGYNLARPSLPETSESPEERLARGYKLLSAAMGNSFGKRFTEIIDALNGTTAAAKPAGEEINKVAKAFDAYDNALQRVKDQNEVMQAQIAAFGKTTEEVDKLRIAKDLERAASRAGREMTPELLAEIDREASAYARLREEIQRMNEARRMVESFGSALVNAFTSGGDAIEKMTSSMAGLGRTLATGSLNRLMTTGSAFGNQSLMSGAGAVGMIGAGAMGYQSGSPLMGALGGAMAGSAFGPVGMLVGGAIGGISGLFGGSAQKKQQEQQMQAEAARIRAQSQLIGLDTSTRSGAAQALGITQQAEIQQFAAQRNWAAVIASQEAHHKQLAVLNAEWDKREIELAEAKRQEQLRIAEESARELANLQKGYADRRLAAVTDTSTVEGALALFDRQAQREREALAENAALRENYTAASVELEATLSIERFRVQDDFNKRTLEETKRAEEQKFSAIKRSALQITDWLLSKQTGVDSPLSPTARYSTASQAYNATLGLAQGNNVDALDRITQDADVFLAASRAKHGSGSQYHADFAMVQQQLSALAAIQNSDDPVVRALNVIAGRQEALFLSGTADATDRAADNTVTANSFLERVARGVELSNTYLAALNVSSAAAAQAAAAAAAAAQASLAADAQRASDELEATKAANRARFNNATRIYWEQYYAANPDGYGMGAPPNEANFQPMRFGGVVGYAEGGMIGNGMWDRDSVFAKNTLGRNIMLAGGEFVMPAPQTQQHYQQLEAMRAGRFAGRSHGNDNSEVAALGAKIERLEGQLADIKELLERVLNTTAAGAEHVRQGVDKVADALAGDAHERILASHTTAAAA